MRALEVVLFDLDDTLHDDTRAFRGAAEEVAQEVAARHGVDALSLKDAYIAQAEGFWQRITPEQLNLKLRSVREQLWAAALEGVGVTDREVARQSAVHYHEYRRKYFVPFPGAIEALRTLRERGLKLGILTNGFAETHREKIEALQLGEYVDAIFIADEMGMLKPNPLMFSRACTTMGSSPARSAMVGDRYNRDISGALEAGMFTVWLNVRNETLPAGVPPPDATCTSIGDVPAALACA